MAPSFYILIHRRRSAGLIAGADAGFIAAATIIGDSDIPVKG
ncbi:hypothetical protein [Paracoccus subflavus]|nr:hypothetical protein [Paracoccus subflavus]